jgi:hypothetical protein
MKNIVKAITGSGLLVSGSILIGQDLHYKLAAVSFILTCVFIVGGILLLIGANTESKTTNVDISNENQSK